MLAGNRDYFVVDMIADTAIQTYMNGKPYVPLLTQGKVDTAMKINRDKALREYYNVPTRDGGENQIVKWGQVRECEKFSLPKLGLTSDSESFVIAMDPARTKSNGEIPEKYTITATKSFEDKALAESNKTRLERLGFDVKITKEGK